MGRIHVGHMVNTCLRVPGALDDAVGELGYIGPLRQRKLGLYTRHHPQRINGYP